MKVTDIVYVHDSGSSSYWIAELDDGRFAFAWGNMIVKTGHDLARPARENVTDLDEIIAASTDEMGASIHDSLAAAELAWLRCAQAVSDTGHDAAALAMAAVLDCSEESGTARLLERLRNAE